MSKGCVGSILTVLAVLGMMAIVYTIGFNALGIILAIFVGICFLDYWIYYGKRSIRESKQTHVICPRCKIPVNKESVIYVPIDYSELKTVIPEGEDILYSSYCQAQVILGAVFWHKWASHVLLTQNYMAYTKPLKRMPAELHLVPLYKVLLFAHRMIFIEMVFYFKLTRDPNYETKECFKERAKIFGYKFLPILLDAKERRLKEMESNPEEFKKRKISKMESKIYKVKKAIEKNKKKYG